MEFNSNKTNAILDLNYYCGTCKCSVNLSTDNKCIECNSSVVKWHFNIESENYIHEYWLDENKRNSSKLFSSEQGALKIIKFGVFLLLIVLVAFLISFPTFKLTTIDSQVFSHFGDIVGGLIGAIWSLAGIVLFYLALKNQLKNNVINRDILFTQVSLLNNQLDEYHESLEQTKIIAKANIETQKDLRKQLDLMNFKLAIEKNAILANVNIQLSRNELNDEHKTKYLLEAKKYIKLLKDEISNNDE